MSNEDRYFYKIIDNVDFVWKIKLIRDDPYKAGEFRVQHFVHNTKRYENRILDNFHSLTQNKFLEGYKEISKEILNEDNCYYDNEIGVVKKDPESGQLVAMRHVVAFDKIVPIELGGQINQEIRDLYDVVMNWNKSFAQAVYNAGHDYYKSLWLIDEFFSSPNLDTVDKFLLERNHYEMMEEDIRADLKVGMSKTDIVGLFGEADTSQSVLVYDLSLTHAKEKYVFEITFDSKGLKDFRRNR